MRWYDFEGEWAWANTDIGIGKLTVNGMKQVRRPADVACSSFLQVQPLSLKQAGVQGFQLGQSLRANYAHNMKLDQQDAVTCYSTDLDRTVDTAHSVLLGLLSEHDTQATEENICECREEHGKRAPPECLASCLQLTKVPKTPQVQVRLRKDEHGDAPVDKDAALYQTDVCKGYDEWRDRQESSAEWLALPKTEFKDAADISAKLVGSDLVKTLNWPGSVCGGCLDLSAPDYNYMAFMETVRLSRSSGFACIVCAQM